MHAKAVGDFVCRFFVAVHDALGRLHGILGSISLLVGTCFLFPFYKRSGSIKVATECRVAGSYDTQKSFCLILGI